MNKNCQFCSLILACLSMAAVEAQDSLPSRLKGEWAITTINIDGRVRFTDVDKHRLVISATGAEICGFDETKLLASRFVLLAFDESRRDIYGLFRDAATELSFRCIIRCYSDGTPESVLLQNDTTYVRARLTSRVNVGFDEPGEERLHSTLRTPMINLRASVN